jgi:hypothetical protein
MWLLAVMQAREVGRGGNWPLVAPVVAVVKSCSDVQLSNWPLVAPIVAEIWSCSVVYLSNWSLEAGSVQSLVALAIMA